MDRMPSNTPDAQERPISRRTAKKIFPYLWRRRWLILLTLGLTAAYSGLMGIRNLLPAVWTDGVLIPDALQADSILTRKLAPLLKRIEATDKLIDQIVYKLYGLTEDEIRIVEESISGKTSNTIKYN